jgi:predicted transcriptional regulator
MQKVYDSLTSEPQTPNEIAEKLGLNQKTAQSALLELANTKKDVKWKKVGRYRLFWKSK